MQNNRANVKVSSKWLSTDMKEFIVLSITEIEEDTWVHYRSNFKEENTEHSCLIDSFLIRFSPAAQ